MAKKSIGNRPWIARRKALKSQAADTLGVNGSSLEWRGGVLCHVGSGPVPGVPEVPKGEASRKRKKYSAAGARGTYSQPKRDRVPRPW
jgi:hypothetical protein